MNRTERLFHAINILTAAACHEARLHLLVDVRHAAQKVAQEQPRLGYLPGEINRLCDSVRRQLDDYEDRAAVPTVDQAEREVEHALRGGMLQQLFGYWPARPKE